MKRTDIRKDKRWVLKADPSVLSSPETCAIADALRLHPAVAALLVSRGFTTPDAAANFLFMRSEMFCDPFLMKDMDAAVARILVAVHNKEKICIWGDYDVDGVTSVSTLYLYLESIGGVVDYYIPDRLTDGYGVTKAALERLTKEHGYDLFVTVDTGITANEEVAFAKTLGADFVVTDHHECHTELPPAIASVNPHRPDCPYPFKELAGVGVAFKLICAIEERRTARPRHKVSLELAEKYADLVAIGTIADVMPIAGENRIIVSYGLAKMNKTERPGLLALMDASSTATKNKQKRRTKVTSGYIGFTLAPRINAAGRIRSASIAVELFLAKDYDHAKRIADELCEANKERQDEENRIMEEATAILESKGEDFDDPVIVLDADHWHHGVIGIVASRITEKYGRPAILISFEGRGEIPTPDDPGKGSGRSVKGINLVDALCASKDTLIKFGGHELAAGLSVRRGDLEAFRKAICDYARANLAGKDMTPTLDADFDLPIGTVTLDFAEALGHLEPYGVGNPVPTFTSTAVSVLDVSSVGDGKHTRVTLGDGERTAAAIWFSHGPESLPVGVGEQCDVMYNVDINEWLGRRTPQLILRDVRPTAAQAEKRQKEAARFEEIRAGAAFDLTEDVLPTRTDFVALYRLVSDECRNGAEELSLRAILAKLPKSAGIEYVKLRFMILIMTEMNLLGIEEVSEEVYRFSVRFSSQKADLERSNLLKKLRSQLRT